MTQGEGNPAMNERLRGAIEHLLQMTETPRLDVPEDVWVAIHEVAHAYSLADPGRPRG